MGTKKSAAAKKTSTKKASTKKATKKKATKKATKKKNAALDAELEQRLAAVPAAVAAENPNEPVAQFVALATRTDKLARSERARLLKLPSFEAWWLKVGALAGALLQADAAWTIARAQTTSGVSPARTKEGEALKSRLFECARFVLRRDPDVQQELDQIGQGTGIADLAVDLERLADLVGRFPESFAAYVDDDAAGRAATLGAELRGGVDRGDAAVTQERRNRLFWLGHEAVIELRDCLRFVWRDEPGKRAELGITYSTRLRKLAKEKKKKTTTPA